ncbi:MAG: MFS transporter [Pseudomonadaceae bacterium]|nr:MFS transporter [Pseudomonadaceae bacterium]
MKATLKSLFSVFLSLAILLLGHGLQQTLLPLHAQNIGWSPAAIGLTGAAYFAGFILGCYCMPRLIASVGHIRVFTVCTALAIVAILTLAQWQYLSVWIVMRLLTGVSLAGFYMVIESWLNENVAERSRGSLLSFYGFVCIGAMAVGQLLLFSDDMLQGAVLAAMIFALAIVPVGLTTSPQPAIPPRVIPRFRVAYQASQVGLIAAAISGFVMGLIWSNGAVFAGRVALDNQVGATFIMAVLLGGLFWQLPLGRLSDHIDRRWVILGTSTLAFVCSISWVFFGATTPLHLYVLGFVVGGSAMPLYSLGVAHANDNARGDFLLIAGALLLANGLGSIAGPLLYAGLVGLQLDNLFFVLIAAAFAVSAVWTGARLVLHHVSRDHFEPYQMVPKTTMAAVDMDPRGITSTEHNSETF